MSEQKLSTIAKIRLRILLSFVLLALTSTCGKESTPNIDQNCGNDGIGCSSDSNMDTLFDPSVTVDEEMNSDMGTSSTTSFQVTVVNGFGSGTYEAGSKVHIWSDHNPRTEILMNWSGDTDILMDTGEWHTSFVMPSRNVTRHITRRHHK